MLQVVQKESHEVVQTIYVNEKANTWRVYYIVKRIITVYYIVKRIMTVSSFVLTSLPHCFSLLSHFCILSYFKIIRCIAKSLITTSTYFFNEIQLKKENLKFVFWVSEFGRLNRYTSLPNDLNRSLLIFFL